MGKFKKWVTANGGPSGVAKHLGITSHAVRMWLRRDNGPTSKTMLKLVRISKGALTCDDIIRETKRRGARK